MTYPTPVGRGRPVARRILMLTTALAATGAEPALAQSANTPQAYATAPADHLLVTPNGVDLRSGRYDYKATDLSIGGDGSAGLQLTRLPRGGIWGHVEPFGNFTHNFDMMIAEKLVHIEGGTYNHKSGSDYRMIVRLGDKVDTFDGYGYIGPYFQQISKGGRAVLTYTGSAASGSVAYSYQAPDGTVIRFRQLGNGECSSNLRCAYASELTYPDGTKLSFEYDSPNSGVKNMTRLRSVTSSRGYALLLEYGGGSWHTVAKACVLNLSRRTKPADNVCPSDPIATSSYTYIGSNEPLLVTSTDATGAQASYQYGFDDGLRTIGFIKPGEQKPWLTNSYSVSNGEENNWSQEGTKEIVVRQALADGRSYSIRLNNAASQTEHSIYQLAGGTITDGQGHMIEAEYGYPKLPKSMIPGYSPEVPDELSPTGPSTWTRYQITPGPISIKDQLGRTTTFEYCDPLIQEQLPAYEQNRCAVTPLRAYTDPEGLRTEVVQDGCGNFVRVTRVPKEGSNLPAITTFATYECLQPKYANKPVAVTDWRGNETKYGYSPDHGGMLYEMQPAPVAGAARPLKTYTYAQRHAYVRNAAGALAPASPIWTPETETQCQTVAGSSDPVCDPKAPRTVTTYEYGPAGTADSLLVRGVAVTADGQSRRTCFGYDAVGNKISETKPRAGLATCS